MVDVKELKDKVHAVLFAAGRTVSLEELTELCDAEEGFIKEALRDLKEDFEEQDSPLFLTQEENGWKLTIREKHLGMVKDITPHMEMGRPVLETLAVIAWKQPVLQAEVIHIRGSGAYEHIAELTHLGFLNKDKEGRSYKLRVTEKFREYFDLPDKEAVKQIFKDIQGVDVMQGEHVGKLEVYEASDDIPQKEEPHVETYGKKEITEDSEDVDEDETSEVDEEVEKTDSSEEQEEQTPEEKEEEILEGPVGDESLTEETLELEADPEKTKEIVADLLGDEKEKKTDSEEKRKLSPELEEFLEEKEE